MAESKDIEINQFPIVSSLSNKDYVVVSLDNGSQGRIKTSDLASVVAGVLGVANIEFNIAVYDKDIWVHQFFMKNKSAAYYNHAIVVNTDGTIFKEVTNVYSGGNAFHDNSVGFVDSVPAGYKILVFTLCFN